VFTLGKCLNKKCSKSLLKKIIYIFCSELKNVHIKKMLKEIREEEHKTKKT
jgi:hypothetical protein